MIRRRFLTLLAAPAVITTAGLLMPVRVPLWRRLNWIHGLAAPPPEVLHLPRIEWLSNTGNYWAQATDDAGCSHLWVLTRSEVLVSPPLHTMGNAPQA